jgi:hypothetical protein
VRNRNEGKAFANWWNDRLLKYCHDDIPSGLFVDQRWCDHVPALFDNVKIIRDPGYNVASWNISHRYIRFNSEGDLLVDESPLRFYHFTKIESVGYTMTQLYAKNNLAIYELCSWYKCMLNKHSRDTIPNGFWHYAIYENGETILRRHRLYIEIGETCKKHFQTLLKNNLNGYLSSVKKSI